MKLPKYKQNLTIQQNQSGMNVWCYDSNIARIFSDKIEVLNKYKKYSNTTTKHYNYVSSYYDKPIIFVKEFSNNPTRNRLNLCGDNK